VQVAPAGCTVVVGVGVGVGVVCAFPCDGGEEFEEPHAPSMALNVMMAMMNKIERVALRIPLTPQRNRFVCRAMEFASARPQNARWRPGLAERNTVDSAPEH
jgi:hypothetical protein